MAACRWIAMLACLKFPTRQIRESMTVAQRRLAVTCFSWVIANALVMSVGCSGRPSNVAKKVTGTITLGGQPLAGAKVVFTPDKGNPSFGTTDAEGKYTLLWSQARGKPVEGAIIGEHIVG